MSFGPALKKIGRAVPDKISAAVIANRSGTLRLVLAISKGLWHRVGQPRHCDVQLGTGDDDGKIRLVFTATGAYRVFNASSGGGKIILPMHAGIPPGFEFNAIACEAVTTPTNIIVTLPLEEWKAMISEAA